MSEPEIEVPSKEALSAVYDAEVEIAAILGQTIMDMAQILKLGRGAIIELDSTQSDPVGLYAGDTLIAFGEVTVREETLAVRVTEMVKAKPR